MSEVKYSLKFHHDNHVIVEDTNGTSDALFRAKTVDPVGYGGGHTVYEAVLSLCESLRETADEIESELFRDVKKW